MAGLEHSSSHNLNLADWLVWRKLIDRLGSGVRIRTKGKSPFAMTSKSAGA